VKIKKRVKKILQLDSQTVEIQLSPNKSNIKFVMAKIPNLPELAMCWLVDGLEDRKEKFPKTVVYCKTIKDVAALYEYLTTENEQLRKHVEMYHSLTPSSQKTIIMDGLKDLNSAIRVVIATSALGMGVDVVSLHCLVVYGPPDSLVDLVQMVGRAGRDDLSSTALLLYNSYHLRGADKEVKAVFKSGECRREKIMEPFLSPEQSTLLKEETRVHSCCNICASSCKCGECSLTLLEKLFHTIDTDSEGPASTSSESTVDYAFSGSDDMEDAL